MTRSCGALLMGLAGAPRGGTAGEGKSEEKKGAPPPPFLRRRPLVPSRAGSPADVSRPGHVLSARVEAGGAASGGSEGGRGRGEGWRAVGRKLALPSSSWRCFPPPYLDVPQCRPQHAQIRCLLVVHVGDVSLQGLKAFLQVGPPGERRGSSAGQPAPEGWGKGEEGEGRAQESLGDQGWDQSHTRTHTHLFFSNLLWTSLVPIL